MDFNTVNINKEFNFREPLKTGNTMDEKDNKDTLEYFPNNGLSKTPNDEEEFEYKPRKRYTTINCKPQELECIKKLPKYNQVKFVETWNIYTRDKQDYFIVKVSVEFNKLSYKENQDLNNELMKIGYIPEWSWLQPLNVKILNTSK